MKKFGPYEVVDVLAVTASGTVMAARLPGWPAGKFAVKHIKSCTSEPDEPQWDSQFFLDRARIQKSVVAAGGRHWVPIHSMGTLPDGAWVAFDYVALSAQKLIDGRVRLSALQLQHIMDGVVKGLVELQQVRYRACGSLKPSNVLITPGDLTQTDVFLTDPAQGPGPTETSDMYALGKLIHQLVLHRPFEATKIWPLPEDEAWEALGKTGQQWRELCSDLLSTQPASRPKLADVCWIVRDLAPRQRIKLPGGRLLLIPGIAACLVLILGLALYIATSSARQQLAEVRRVWAAPLDLAMADPDRRTRFESDPDLKTAIEHLDGAGLQAISSDSTLSSNLSPLELRHLRQALAQVQQVEQDLSPEHWRLRAELGALQQKFQGRGWDQPADFIAKLLRATTPSVTLIDGIDHVLKLEPLIGRDKGQVENDWRELDKNCKQLEKTSDRTLWSFARSLRNSASAAIKLSDSGFGGIDTLKANSTLSSKLVQAVPADWPANVDLSRLNADTLASANVARPAYEDIERWLSNLPLYSIRTAETALAAAELQKRLKDVERTVAKSKPTDEDQTAFNRAREQVASRIQAFGKFPFIEKEVEGGRFATQQSAIDLEIQSLKRFARAESLVELVSNLPPVATSSPAINHYWDAWKAKIATQTRPNLPLLKAQSEQLRSMLLDLDQEVPAWPGGLGDSFTTAAQHHREELIQSLLESIDPKAPQIDALRLASAAASYGQWGKSLQKLAQDFPIRKQLLTLQDKPDEKWSPQSGFWDDPEIQQLVKPDVQRLASLRALVGMPRQQLLDIAKNDASLELAFAAWRLLGEAKVQPTWPHDASELNAERDLHTRLAGLVAKLKDGSEKEFAQSLLIEQERARWRSALEHASGEETLAAAWGLRDSFGVDEGGIKVLPAPARFNLWLWRTRQSLASNDERGLQANVDELVKAASETKGVGALVASLTAPPAKASLVDAQEGDQISVSLAGTQPPAQFRRVDVPDGQPFYLCTTEVSLGQFVAVVDAAQAWQQCRQLPWPYLEGGRRGPRVWEWASSRLQPAQLWLGREEDNDFAPPLRAERFNRMVLSDLVGGMPSAQHPMQQVSAQTALWFAGLCRCRLPSSREWLAAYTQFEKNNTPDQMNLRDLTWELQRRYTSDGRPTLANAWPYEDVFQSEDEGRVSLVNDMRTRTSNDGALLFRPVGQSGGSVFHHLVGNVAEYLCDEPEKFDALGESKSPQAVLDFVRQAQRSLFVIGGSALSPPNVPVDKPLPVPRPDQSFSDVGLRLAISAPPRSLAERVRWALRGQNYHWASLNADAAQVKLEH